MASAEFVIRRQGPDRGHPDAHIRRQIDNGNRGSSSQDNRNTGDQRKGNIHNTATEIKRTGIRPV